MPMRSLGHRTIGMFYYPSVDVELTLRFTTLANSFSWSSSGFCCFSMWFIVVIDLLPTVIQPVSVAYVSCLRDTSTYCNLFSSLSCRLYICCIVGQGKSIPMLLLIMIAAVYSVQVLVFILRLGRHPAVLLPTTLLVLENGRFLLGTNSWGSLRVWEEDYRSCTCCVISLLQR